MLPKCAQILTNLAKFNMYDRIYTIVRICDLCSLRLAKQNLVTIWLQLGQFPQIVTDSEDLNADVGARGGRAVTRRKGRSVDGWKSREKNDGWFIRHKDDVEMGDVRWRSGSIGLTRGEGRAMKERAVIEGGAVVKQGTWEGKRAASGSVIGRRTRGQKGQQDEARGGIGARHIILVERQRRISHVEGERITVMEEAQPPLALPNDRHHSASAIRAQFKSSGEIAHSAPLPLGAACIHCRVGTLRKIGRRVRCTRELHGVSTPATAEQQYLRPHPGAHKSAAPVGQHIYPVVPNENGERREYKSAYIPKRTDDASSVTNLKFKAARHGFHATSRISIEKNSCSLGNSWPDRRSL
ncbi:hypothetical protein B0H13DRAFT_2517737 [Mycena leptocephala]|nr:hypothetical protein B0H13DRAFT_2517737 [Mycena leptocephala]